MEFMNSFLIPMFYICCKLIHILVFIRDKEPCAQDV